MYCSYAKFKRRARSTLLLMAGTLCFVFIGSATSFAATVNSPKPNSLFVSASVPSGFNNALCVVIQESSNEESQTIRLDCASNPSVNVQLVQGSYTVLGAYTERNSDQYEVTCDTMSFTIGDGSSPSLTLTIQSPNEVAAPISTPTSETPLEDTPADASSAPTEQPSSTEDIELQSSSDTEPIPSQDQNTEYISSDEEETATSEAEEGERTEETKPTNILRTIFITILSLFGSVIMFSAVAVATYAWRNRNE